MGSLPVEVVRGEVSAAWPDVDWGTAALQRGAFHDVLVADRVVARVSRSQFAAVLMPERVEMLRRLRGAVGTVVVPEPASDIVQWSDVRAGVLLTVAPGRTRSLGDAIRASGLVEVLHSIVSTSPSTLADQAVRGWCGGLQFPRLVTDVVVPRLPDELRPVASMAVAELLEMEDACRKAPVHGDLTPFNITWVRDKPVGVLDWDAAAIADPALDIASLLTTLGTSVAERLCDDITLVRATKHRATFPLQVACAGHLHDDDRLFQTGIDNFVSRHHTGTLYWPGRAGTA